MRLEAKVKKAIMEAVEKYLENNENSHVIVDFTSRSGEVTAAKADVVPNAYEYFAEKGFSENGFKRFGKKSRVNSNTAYIIFETERLGGALGNINCDIGNIENDAMNCAKI